MSTTMTGTNWTYTIEVQQPWSYTIEERWLATDESGWPEYTRTTRRTVMAYDQDAALRFAYDDAAFRRFEHPDRLVRLIPNFAGTSPTPRFVTAHETTLGRTS